MSLCFARRTRTYFAFRTRVYVASMNGADLAVLAAEFTPRRGTRRRGRRTLKLKRDPRAAAHQAREPAELRKTSWVVRVESGRHKWWITAGARSIDPNARYQLDSPGGGPSFATMYAGAWCFQSGDAKQEFHPDGI